MQYPQHVPPMIQSIDLQATPGHLIRRAQQIAVAIFAEQLASADITPVQFAILNALLGSPGIDQVSLAKRVAFDPAALLRGVALANAILPPGLRAPENAPEFRQRFLFVTLEPCVMCAGAIVAARIPRVVFGAWDEKAGAAGSLWDLLRDRRSLHQVEVISGVLEKRSQELLKKFFEGVR